MFMKLNQNVLYIKHERNYFDSNSFSQLKHLAYSCDPYNPEYLFFFIQMIKHNASHLASWCLLVLIVECIVSSTVGSKANRSETGPFDSDAVKTIESEPLTTKSNRTEHVVPQENALHKTSDVHTQKEEKLGKTSQKDALKVSKGMDTASTPVISSTHSADNSVTERLNMTSMSLFKKINSTLTRSKDAVWATISITFICIVLLLAVAQSKMWKEYHPTELQGIPRPNFNERVPFKEVMRRNVKLIREIISKKKKKRTFGTQPDEIELESLLVESDESE